MSVLGAVWAVIRAGSAAAVPTAGRYLGAEQWVAPLYLAVIRSSALAYLPGNRALVRLPAAMVGTSLRIQPILGAGLSWLFLSEQRPPTFIPGAVLVLAAVGSPGAPARARERLQHQPEAVAARIAGRAQPPVPSTSDRVGAAEVEVQAAEPVHPLTPRLQPLELARIDPALAVEPVALDMDTGAETASATGMPWSTTLRITWVIAERSRLEPDSSPTTSRNSAVRPSEMLGACMLVSRPPGPRCLRRPDPPHPSCCSGAARRRAPPRRSGSRWRR